MARYFLFEEQHGGCDYTIGCGKRLTEIEGVGSLSEAIAKVSATTVNKYGEEEFEIITDGEWAVEKAKVLEVSGLYEMDLTKLRSERAAVRNLKAKLEKDSAERKEYERLKKKFD